MLVVLLCHTGLTYLLKLDEFITLNECYKIVTSMAAAADKNCKHIDYLVRKGESPGSGLAATLLCDFSNFPWKKLFLKPDLNLNTVQAITLLKGTFSVHDIEQMVKIVADEKVDILHFAIQNCSRTIYEAKFKYLFNQALKLKKLKFAEEFIKCSPSLAKEHSDTLIKHSLKLKYFDIAMNMLANGAELDPVLVVKEMNQSDISNNKSSIITWLKSTTEGCIQLFLKAIECCDFTVAEDCLRTEESSNIINDISIVSVLRVSVMGSAEERQKRILFLQGLFTSGLDVNKRAEDGMHSLDFVMELPKDKEVHKIELLMLLIQHGASIECCTYQKKNQTTLLHIATRLAIESGKH